MTGSDIIQIVYEVSRLFADLVTPHPTFMIRRSLFRILPVVLGLTVVLSCADVGPDLPTVFPKPLRVNGNNTFTDLSLGDFHSCGLQANGQAFCWGLNAQGQSGNGISGGAGVNTPTIVIGGYLFSSLSAGGNHTCGITLGGTTMCWGNNVGGQLGSGSTINQFEPAPVAGGHAFIQVSSSTVGHTCGLKTNGEVWCWGVGDSGRLGNGLQAQQNSPVKVGGGVKFISISAGGAHTCGIAADSSAYCWGLNSRGQLGEGTTTDRSIPTKASTTVRFKQIAAGLAHTCALSENGDAYCWGDNVVGALGDGTFNSKSVPTPIDGVFTFETIAVGERHACGLDATGVVRCWGYNEFGSLGDGTIETRTTPVALFGTTTFKKIAAGAYHTCGISVTNLAYCWGNNYGYQLGVNDNQQP